MAGARQSISHLVAQHYPEIATDLVNPLLRTIQLAKRYCGGDLDKFLVLLIVAVQTTRHKGFTSEPPERLMSGEIPVFPGYGANVRSIADSLDMPKETARRKVQELLEVGWLARQDGLLYFTARAYQQLAPVQEAIETLAVRYFEVVTKLQEREG
jgi:hypothetical protein